MSPLDVLPEEVAGPTGSATSAAPGSEAVGSVPPVRYRFGSLTLDTRTLQLVDGDDEVALEPQVLGVLATFDGPGRAVRCALGLRDAVAPLGLDVRSGLHTSEVRRRGRDVAGIGVHLAARVAGLAHPGEVWVSRTVTDLVAGTGLAFEDRGTHELRGFTEPWRLFAAIG